MAFRTSRRGEFQHCDPAGLGGYPRYFEWTNSVVEEWFADILAAPFAPMHLGARKGVPTARLEARFAAPTRLGETLDFRLQPDPPGRSSLNLAIEAEAAGETRLVFASTLVHIDLDRGRPEPWPQPLREALVREAAA